MMEGGGNAERTCDTQLSVRVGCRLRIRIHPDDEWAVGEIMQILECGGTKSYLVHYVDYSMREDEWVTGDRLDMTEVDFPDNIMYSATATASVTDTVENTSSASRQRVVNFSEALHVSRNPRDVNPVSLDENSAAELRRRLPPGPALVRHRSMSLDDELPARQQNIRMIELGKYRIRPFYYSPYPEVFEKLPCMYICEFCLKPTKSRSRLAHHLAKCNLRHPPGKEIYREENISFFEVDGHTWKKYTQNLCLLGQLFLPHRTAGYRPLDPFVYYVLTHSDSHGCHIMGFFNRVKEPYAYFHRCTSAVTFPPYKDMGCGKLLADFTYKLFPLDAHLGLLVSESPLSLAGNIYQSHWSETLLDYLVDIKPPRTGGTRPVITFKAAHKGQFLFSCGACGQSVCVASNISHVGECDNRQPFLCQYCGESFVRLANLSTLKSINTLVAKFGLQDHMQQTPTLSQEPHIENAAI